MSQTQVTLKCSDEENPRGFSGSKFRPSGGSQRSKEVLSNLMEWDGSKEKWIPRQMQVRGLGPAADCKQLAEYLGKFGFVTTGFAEDKESGGALYRVYCIAPLDKIEWVPHD